MRRRGKKNMCKTQFELMNHIANTLLEIQRKQNLLTHLVIKRDEKGSELLKEFVKKKKILIKERKKQTIYIVNSYKKIRKK